MVFKNVFLAEIRINLTYKIDLNRSQQSSTHSAKKYACHNHIATYYTILL